MQIQSHEGYYSVQSNQKRERRLVENLIQTSMLLMFLIAFFCCSSFTASAIGEEGDGGWLDS